MRREGGVSSSAAVSLSGGWGREKVRRKRTISVVGHNLKVSNVSLKSCAYLIHITNSNHIA